MGNSILKSITFALLLCISITSFSQATSTIGSNKVSMETKADTIISNQDYLVTLYSGVEFEGEIVSQTEFVIILKTNMDLELTIKKNDIKTISAIIITPGKNVIKTNPFSLFLGSVNIGYERSIGNKISLEGTFGYIGIKDHNDRHDKGYYVSGAVKIFLPKSNNIKNKSNLSGWYFKPSITYLDYTTKYTEEITQKALFITTYVETKYHEQEIISGSLFLSFGHQLVIGNTLLLDFYAGPGISSVNKTIISGEPHDPGFHYAYVGKEMVFTGGFKLGVVF